MEAGVVLVDIGGGTTDVAIFQDNIIRHTAVIPLGGNILTEDIKKGCAIMMRQAEKLKTQFGSALAVEMRDNEIICIPGLRDRPSREISRKNLAHIIESRMTEIIELVNYEIVNSGFADHLFGGIVLTGGGAQLKHLPQLVQFLTGMDCRVGLPNEYLVDSPAEAATGPMFATGIGLVIKGFDNIPLIEKTPEFERIRPATRGAQPTEIPTETPVENPFENPLDSMESEPFPTDMEDALPEALPKSGVRLGDRIQGLNERMMKKILDFFQGDSEFQDELDDTPRENRRR
jgi:cell division protein FtsA